ncbi:hypothetical protein JHK84_045297 [Glycine max]|uniref:NADP-dependent oxidoreductase domain-containing protein n=2 Tax=Glycine subgen. Soja TaxID=1462606 RepID=A0A0R0FWW7_SOYBN|nr:hypothetical protein JHK86_045241 [Glycine max]KAG5108390.1 hypothetical protein JHK84_045297 [Glycine max]RZB60697.1 putative aldo-keto reductase 1 [Glycine soja]
MTDILRVKLGSQGLEVSKLGFGCMGLTKVYNDPVPKEVGISLIKYTFSKGITFFVTVDFYRPHANKVLVEKVVRGLPQDQIQIPPKFGIVKMDNGNVIVNGSPEYV